LPVTLAGAAAGVAAGAGLSVGAFVHDDTFLALVTDVDMGSHASCMAAKV
jgi:hypothetical protein